MADKKPAKGHYRDTRTGAIRISSTPLGYPYEKATAAEVKALNESTSTDAAGGAQAGNAGATHRTS